MWTTDKTSLLIEQWRMQPSLYDIEDADYHNKTKRDESLNNIRMELDMVLPGVTIADIKNKIRGLRTQYARERTHMKFALRSGNHNYKPKLWCYNAMSFLKDSSNIKTFFKKQSMNRVFVPIGQRPIQVKQEKNMTEIIAYRKSNPSTTMIKSDLDEDFFAKCISNELSRIENEDILSDTKLKIFTLITDALKRDRDGRRLLNALNTDAETLVVNSP